MKILFKSGVKINKKIFLLSILLMIIIIFPSGCYDLSAIQGHSEKIVLEDVKVGEEKILLHPEDRKFFQEKQAYLYNNGMLYLAERVAEENKIYIYKNESVKVSTKFFEEDKIYIYENGSLISAESPAGEVIPAEEAISVPIGGEAAPDWILEKGKEHIVSYVGEEYFDEHISVAKSQTMESNTIGTYRIYYNYKFKIKGNLNETSIGFVLFLDPDGNLVDYRGIKYRGPQKPYTFNISEDEAIEIAKEEGLPGSAIKIIEKAGKTYNTTKLTTASIDLGIKFSNLGVNESYIWYVATENHQSGKPVAVYINVDSGEVLAVYPEKEDRIRVCEEGKGCDLFLTEEQKILVERLLMEEDPEILEKTHLYGAWKVVGEPNQLLFAYGALTIMGRGTRVIVDLENETIISIEKGW